MRLTISREKLQEGLASVGSVISSKTTLPVLSNVLLKATADGLSLAATDLDVTIETKVAADVDAGGAITIPAKRLSDIARELVPAPVKLSSVGDQRLVLECGRAHFKILGLPQEDFPALPNVEYDADCHVAASALQMLIAHTAFAASTEESRPILNGVVWNVGTKRMTMVATNGHRLAKMELASKGLGKLTGDMIIPPKALDQVRRLFPEAEQLAIGRGQNHVSFRSPFTTVITRLIEGPYPPYEQVIPKDNDKLAIVDKDALSGALRRMSVIASDQTHRVRLTFNTGILRFSVQTPDLGEAQDEIPVQYNGDPLDIGFNGSYLLEILKYMPTQQVKLTFKGAERAATIEPHEWSGSAEYICLVMPLRLVD